MLNSKRHQRLRREYLYKKGNELQQNNDVERRMNLKRAIDEGVSTGGQLKLGEKDSKQIRRYIKADDDFTRSGALTHVDDEYAYAGVKDPKICITTSHDPSSRLKRFAKEVRLLFPNSQRVNRGNAKVSELVETCVAADFTDIIVLHEHRGEPDRMTVCHLPYGPTCSFAISNCVMRLDVQHAASSSNFDDEDESEEAQAARAVRAKVSEAYPHLIFENFNTPLGKRISDILRFLYPVPKLDSKRVMTFYNSNDFVSFRHHVYAWGTTSKDAQETNEMDKSLISNDKIGKGSNKKDESIKAGVMPSDSEKREIVLQEIGPRFELRPYEIRLGTLDNDDAQVEWVLHSFMNSSKKNVL